ncbi:MAG: type II toxin-antitoxin system death-on-curing family toxin [Candidatus Paceibacterota bacterium]
MAEVEYMAFTLTRKLMTYNEPIPEFGTRFHNILESCLAVPFIQFNKKDLYRGFIGKSSILFYLLIKNHPFQNGNKRIAIMTLLCFLSKNGKWLQIGKKDLYNFAKGIAKSKPKSREKVMLQIQTTIKKYLIDLQ